MNFPAGSAYDEQRFWAHLEIHEGDGGSRRMSRPSPRLRSCATWKSGVGVSVARRRSYAVCGDPNTSNRLQYPNRRQPKRWIFNRYGSHYRIDVQCGSLDATTSQKQMTVATPYGATTHETVLAVSWAPATSWHNPKATKERHTMATPRKPRTRKPANTLQIDLVPMHPKADANRVRLRHV
jgi:hypothetical protein